MGPRMLGVVTMLAVCACDDSGARPSSAPLRDGRLYSGAPPVIPHAVAELGRELCLDCHLEGDAVDEDGRVAPATPHPELERCEQCHLRRVGQGQFRPTTLRGAVYRIGQRQQPRGPWLIPHPLTLRESCLGCHGSGAADWLRTSHPERARCLQCHLPRGDWPRMRTVGYEGGRR